MHRILLCADSDSLSHPALLGLEDVDLDAISWLECFSCAAEMRERIRAGLSADEIWIASSDDVEAINLLAALRKDDPDVALLLVVQRSTGSVLSRAQSAGANGTLTIKGFAERFALENLRYARMQEAAFADDDSLLDDIPAYALAASPDDGGSGSASTPDIPAADAGSACDAAVAPSANEAEGRSAVVGASDATCAKHERQAEYIDGQAFILTVLSGSGGAGKSTVSAISAAFAAERGHKTLLVDCDLQFGDVHRLMGQDDPLTLDDVLEDPAKLEALAGEEGDGGPYLLAAPKRLEQSEVISQYLPKILESASGLFDAIVVNTGANWADHHAVLLERSDCSLLLVDQRASSVRACQHALELCSRLGIASGAFAYAVNHCERGALFTSMDVAFVMQGAHVFELKEGGPEVEEMLGAGRLSDLLASKNGLCESIGDMLSDMLPDNQVKERKHKRSRRKKISDGQLGTSESLSLGGISSTETKSGNPRKRASRRRGRAAKLESLPMIEESACARFDDIEEKALGLWR